MVGCPTCGAALRFDIATQKMACDYCGGSFETQTLSDNSLRDDARASCFDSYVYIGGLLSVLRRCFHDIR